MFALRGEEDDDGEDEADERPGRDEADEVELVFALAEEGAEGEAGDDGGGEGDAEEDGDALGDVGVAYVHRTFVVTDDFDVKESEGREEDYLQDGVEGDQDGAVISVAVGQVRPDEHHGDTSCYADEDEALAKIGAVREEGPCETAHEERGEDPVEDEGEEDLDPEGPFFGE